MNSFKTSLYERVFYPLYQIKSGPFYGSKIISVFNNLNNSQWLSHDETIAFQTNKLKKIISHAYINVPYYRDVMNKEGMRPEDIRSSEDIKYFPFLTKEIIRDNYVRLLTKDIKKRKFTEASTGGSTGEPLRFVHDIQSRIWAEACLLRGMSWAGYKIGDRVIDFRSTDNPSMLGLIRTKIVNNYCYRAYSKKEEIIGHMQKIKSIRPYALTGYASNLYRIAKVCQNNAIKDVRFPVIYSTAEMLYQYQKELLEKQFESRVFDYYGCNEVGSLAYECEYNTKHISDEHVILEITDAGGMQRTDTPGEVTVTDLDNYVMPFIRYKNGDVGVVNRDTCKCGRGLRILDKVEGRTQDFLKTTDGNYVPSIFFPTRFRGLRGIKKYQIIQNDMHNITLKVVKGDSLYEQELNEMKKTIAGVMGDNVHINVEECTDIPLTGRGKTRLVISKLPTEL